MNNIHVKRIYEDVASEDGSRVLIDRLWPRGIAKEDARLDEWAKALAPSSDLRQWFGHDSERFEEFARRYHAELKDNGQAVDDLLERIDQRRRLTLLTASKRIACSHAVVLRQHLLER